MAVESLPDAFRKLRLNEAEREAAIMLYRLAKSEIPGIEMMPRRTESGCLKMDITYPEGGNLYEMAKKMAKLSNEVQDVTGVDFLLD